MNVKIIRKSQLAPTPWSGGSSTQLFIWPQGAEYVKRDFIFRISTASVEAEESVFTALPGVRRKLMVLDGVLQLTHKDKYSKTLHKFDTDEFLGDWETSAKGRVKDFNLMMREKVEGSLKFMSLKLGERGSLKFASLKEGEESKLADSTYTFIYVYKGAINTDNEKAGEGDFVVFEGADTISFTAVKNSELVITKVSFIKAQPWNADDPA